MRATLACAVLFAGLGAVVAAPVPKEPPTPAVTPEHLAASRENVKQIVAGIIWHADTNVGRLPTDITDKNGKPLLSWRVALLEYIDIELGALYKQFKIAEPWDSEHNKKLIEKMPKVYAPVRVRGRVGETYYQVFTGAGALFGPKQQPWYPGSIPDGTANTVIVVEAGSPVVWTKPADVPFDAKKALPKLGGLFDGEFHAGMCDGSVKFFRKDFDADEMRKAIVPNDGFPVDFKKLEK
jgi:hypothetical protein